MSIRETVSGCIDELRNATQSGSGTTIRKDADNVITKLLAGAVAAQAPDCLLRAPESVAGDYQANWNHQVWYHLTELERIHDGELDRAEKQGGDAWVGAPRPEPEDEMASQIRELAKVVACIDSPPPLVDAVPGETLFEDALLDREGAWDWPDGLAIERDETDGTAWQGQNPGGDWFWLKSELPDSPLSIAFDLKPISTILGGLIIGFCAKPVKPGTPWSVASGPLMGDYFNNFSAYHFSIHRGDTGYCNLRRAGVGLLMLASFPDPCPDKGRWYRIEVVKNGDQIELRVDGRLSVCYLDRGHVQPLLGAGHLGFRHFQGFYGWQRNLRISRVGG